MDRRRITCTSMLLLTILLFLSTSISARPHTSIPQTPIKAGYYPSWLYPSFPPSSINPSLFTHVLFAFAEPDPSTFQLTISSSDAAILANFSSSLRAKPVKTLLSIGGGGANTTVFEKLASAPSSRAVFIQSTISVARRYELDGVDLDWEFPANPGQMSDLGDLFVEWRAAVEEEAAATGRPRLLLTAAVYFAQRFFLPGDVPRAYPAAAIAASLDWVNAMCFDFHGSWDTSATGEHAALYDSASNVSGSYGLKSWVAAGVPAKKVVIGLPLYGRTWRLKNPAEHGIGAAAVGVGSGEDGVMRYDDVVDYNKEKNAHVVFDKMVVGVYSYAGDNWIGYDDLRSVRKKIEYAKGLGLGGYFFWAIGYNKDWSISKGAWKAWGH
ncbi:class V chitinase CHIT5a-like [Typha latifolia]|uniref:class V chitinase CHIT5a-like n=1 Tax=Typha latifolia TaxID=4733 RepID=UPI003C2D9382